jgi:hypothetical protein
VSDRHYTALFDAAFEACPAPDPSERKRKARAAANHALQVVRSGAADAELNALTADLTPQIGARGAPTITKIVRDMRPAVRRQPLWRPSTRLKIALMTAEASGAIADEIYASLVQLGADIWYYRRSLRVGRRIRNEDDRALTEADYILLLVSNAALASNFVQYETDVALWLEMADRRERLIPVIVDDLAFEKLPPWLGIIQCLRYRDIGIDGIVEQIKARVAEDRVRRR